MKLQLNQTAEGVCPIVSIVFGMRGVGKTQLMQACAPLFASDRRKLVIVSPIQTLKRRMPDVPWYQITVTSKDKIEKLFRGFLKDGKQRFVLCDEGDELTAANASGTAGGFVAQAVYDYVNYGREQGLGIMFTTRRPQNIAKDTTANANLVFIGTTVDPASLDYYSGWMVDPANPDFDWRARCRLLKEYYFMAWAPSSRGGFLGYLTVDMDSGELRECSEQEALGSSAPNADDTEKADTTGTGESAEGGAPSESSAPSAASPSPTAPARDSAPSA